MRKEELQRWRNNVINEIVNFIFSPSRQFYQQQIEEFIIRNPDNNGFNCFYFDKNVYSHSSLSVSKPAPLLAYSLHGEFREMVKKYDEEIDKEENAVFTYLLMGLRKCGTAGDMLALFPENIHPGIPEQIRKHKSADEVRITLETIEKINSDFKDEIELINTRLIANLLLR
ncbi:hypothetical protein [Marinobacterium litorale]|uniref:hypothetical protein n=1 Tax=Marinobacterium litorale TaxID=404770 RepID=UPI0004861E0D|nr:hypothetical protein [Marinobacterium litorale]